MQSVTRWTGLVSVGLLALHGCAGMQEPSGKEMTFFVTSAGPWHNAKGVMIAANVDDLHSARANLTKETALDEKGRIVNGRTEKPNKHDILTGTRPDGTAFAPSPFFPDMTCGNWTKSGADSSAMTGHHDRAGPTRDAWATSWNSAHPSRGCSQQALRSTGGDGLFYCFAVK